MVFQHTAGRLPGVLVALPGVHPGTMGGKRVFPLVSSLSLFSYWFPPKTTTPGAEQTWSCCVVRSQSRYNMGLELLSEPQFPLCERRGVCGLTCRDAEAEP